MDEYVFNINEISDGSVKERLDFVEYDENLFSEKCLRSVEDKLFVENFIGFVG